MHASQAALVYLRARWYCTSNGTFTAFRWETSESNDRNPFSHHPYAYALSNPVLYTDPTGKCVSEEVTIFGVKVKVPGGQKGCPERDLWRDGPNWEDGGKAWQAIQEPIAKVADAIYRDITRSPQQRWDDYWNFLNRYGPLSLLNGDPLSVPFMGPATNLRFQVDQVQGMWQGFSALKDDLTCGDSYRLLRGLTTIEVYGILGRFSGVGLKRLATWEINRALLAELRQAGIKHTPSAIVRIARMPDGQIVFLEQGRGGNGGAGLQHVLEHADDFTRRGITNEQIPDLLMEARRQNNIVGYQGKGTGRPIYAVTFNGRTHYIAISIGTNGFIVGANPATWP